MWAVRTRLRASVVAATTAGSEVEVLMQHPTVADLDGLPRTCQGDLLKADDRSAGLNIEALGKIAVGWQRCQSGVRVLDLKFAVH